MAPRQPDASPYVPQQGPHSGPQQAVDGDAGPMQPGCDHLDPATPALCHAHCLDGKTSLDKPQTPVAAPARAPSGTA